MKGDFSRSTFDPRKHYNSVRMQQGRVQLDADWNEQVDILLHSLRAQMADLLGPGAAVTAGQGFAITIHEPEVQNQAEDQLGVSTAPARQLPDFEIGPGHCYVDGILCENEAPVSFSKQPDYPGAASEIQQSVDSNQYLVYLDVWQREIMAAEDPAIREIALGGVDTAMRLKTVWQVKLLPISGAPGVDQNWRDQDGLRSLAEWVAFVNRGGQALKLKARWDAPASTSYLENRLYRVEIHSGGDQPTFKWSRENGSVVFPIIDIDKPSSEQLDGMVTLRVTVGNLDRDPNQIRIDSWVEFADDDTVLNSSPLPLCKCIDLDPSEGHVILQAKKETIEQILAELGERKDRHRLIRRWESNEIPLVHSANSNGDEWLDLENGIQIAFSEFGACQPGDFWLIPSRTQLESGIDWPQENDQPQAQAPHGITHHFAPLVLLQFQARYWSVTQPTAFRTLPHITKQLTDTDAVLKDVSGGLKQVREDVDTLMPLTQDLSSLDQLRSGVGELGLRVEQASESLNKLHKAVDKLTARMGGYGGVSIWLIPLMIGIGFLLTYLMIAQGNQRQQAATDALQTAMAQNVAAIQQANQTAIAQQATLNAIQTVQAHSPAAIQPDTPTATHTPTLEVSPSPTLTATLTATFTPTPTGTIAPSLTPTDTATAIPSELTGNLLSNASFEQDPQTNGTAWSALPVYPKYLASETARNIYEWSTERARTGTHSFLFIASHPLPGWPGWFTVIPLSSIELNSAYTFRAWSFTPDGANTWLSIDYLDAKGNLLIGYSTGCRAPTLNSWQLYERSLPLGTNVPAGATQIQLGLQQCQVLEGKPKSLYFDDVYFGKTNP